MNGKHTPGPWIWTWYDCGSICIDLGKDSNGWHIRKRICDIKFIHTHTLKRDVWAECKANACLIAAAPDMLKILKTIVVDYRFAKGHEFYCENIENAEAAITKAEGENVKS